MLGFRLRTAVALRPPEMKLLPLLALLLMAPTLTGCGTKGPLYLPKTDPAQASKAPPVPPLEPVPETTDKPGL
jgi:predicted small lipoprotein YifL